MPQAAAILPPLPIAPNARLRVGKLCVAVQGGSPGELVERAERGLKDARFFEFRLDTLPKPAAAFPYLRQFLSEHRDVIALATCRRKENGGHFAGSLQAELSILTEAVAAGCQMIDLEIESAEQIKAPQIAKLRASGAAVLISYHDFTRTRSLEQVADRIERFKPDFVKIVSTARSLADNLAILRLIEDRSLASNVVGIAMGEEGILSRLLGPRAGAAFTFAALSDATETAAGQISARTLLDMYRVEHLDQATR